MLGEVSCSDLTGFFRLFILNREHLSNGSTITSNLASKLSNLLRKTNTLTTARLNIAAHYDISNEMFEAFLSPDMTYSCPIWLPKTDPKYMEETAQQAQERKLRRFITNAKIQKNDHVLEIGTGWGSFAIMAVRETGCRVTSLTLSKEQKALAEQRIAAAGFTENIEVLLCDYRALPVPKDSGLYDKVVSIEMLEAVGREYLATYFECVDKLMKKDGGIAVFQCITMPESASLPVAADAITTDLLAALRDLRQLGRFHPSLHLPWWPSSIHNTASRDCTTRIQMRTDSRDCRKHRSSLRQNSANLERELHGKFRQPHQACAVG